jgi:uncharacterized protein with HEPN domain
MVQNAVMRSFEVVGEAARRISYELRGSHPEVPWRLMSDFRNKLIHDYFGLDLEAIWRTATEDTLVLLQEIEKLIAEA